MFRSLNRVDIRKIVALELDKLSLRLADHKIILQPTEAALDFLAEEGFDTEMGARPVRRIIQQQLEDKLSDAMLSGKFEDGQTVVIDVETIDDPEKGETRQIVLRCEKENSEEPQPELQAEAQES